MDDPNGYGEHPKGTLALMALMGLLYVLGWAAVYVFLYLGRGPLTP